jgi:hypothetical protein
MPLLTLTLMPIPINNNNTHWSNRRAGLALHLDSWSHATAIASTTIASAHSTSEGDCETTAPTLALALRALARVVV